MPVTSSLSQPVILAILGIAAAGHRSAGGSDGAPALSVSGHPATAATAAAFYAFTPNVQQNGGRQLQFSIQNKPSWASFGARHGTLYGVPQAANAGSYPNIIITVSDGHQSVQLPAFSIRVAPFAAQSP